MSLQEYNYTVTTRGNDENWNPTEYKFLYRETAGGTFARDNSQATISYMCDFQYVDRFLDTVLGKTVKGSGSGGGLLRAATTGVFGDTQGSLPELHPIFSNYYAASAEVEPVGVRPNNEAVSRPFWSKAKVTVVFRPPPYNVIGDGVVEHEYDRYTTKTIESNAEFQTSTGFFQFVSDPSHRMLDITPGQTIAAVRKTYTWHNIPTVNTGYGVPDLSAPPNFDTITSLQGKVNEVEFDGYAPGTVLFTTWNAKLILPQTATEGGYYWDVSYVLGIRDYGESTTPVVAGEGIGWNYAFDPLRKVWDLYTTDGTTGGGTMYLYSDLNDLFSVSW